MIPAKFEYCVPRYKFDEATNQYIEYQDKNFVTILEEFKHPYVDKMMYHIRRDYIDPDGTPASEEMYVMESMLRALLDLGGIAYE